MAISFLDLVPKPPTDVVTIDTLAHGRQDIELTGVSLRALADISKRFPAFAKVLDGGVGGILDNPDAVAAIVAASLGHAGQKEYEAHVAAFPTADMLRIALVVVRLTFPQSDADPLSPAALNGAGGDAPDPISPSPLNS
jgi:hypothetical protein